jgi:uracil-DNA glycosylase
VVTLLDGLPDGARVVLVGARALDAYNDVFGEGVRLDWFGREGWSARVGHMVSVTAIPHPSGRNPMYNDPATVAAARRAVRWAAGIEDK